MYFLLPSMLMCIINAFCAGLFKFKWGVIAVEELPAQNALNVNINIDGKGNAFRAGPLLLSHFIWIWKMVL